MYILLLTTTILSDAGYGNATVQELRVNRKAVCEKLASDYTASNELNVHGRKFSIQVVGRCVEDAPVRASDNRDDRPPSRQAPPQPQQMPPLPMPDREEGPPRGWRGPRF